MRAMNGAVVGARPIHVQYSEKRPGSRAAERQSQDAHNEPLSQVSGARSKTNEFESEADYSDNDSQDTSVDTVRSCLTECEWQAIEARTAFQTLDGRVSDVNRFWTNGLTVRLSFFSRPEM